MNRLLGERIPRKENEHEKKKHEDHSLPSHVSSTSVGHDHSSTLPIISEQNTIYN